MHMQPSHLRMSRNSTYSGVCLPYSQPFHSFTKLSSPSCAGHQKCFFVLFSLRTSGGGAGSFSVLSVVPPLVVFPQPSRRVKKPAWVVVVAVSLGVEEDVVGLSEVGEEGLSEGVLVESL